ncbi:lipid-A-disaccharide synthase [Succinimonas amylolytica]|uniref:lipid-A-disaccharide synthase n=1 Tax=Succinimonas amylolytica TaxID=83769 RepID=UPI000362E1C4|nr:lipid-A-disaccharide synthase [Succinimonas amylolytica]
MPLASRNHLYALSACEASGDALGAGLVCELMKRDSRARFTGIFGPRMRAAAGSRYEQLYDMEELSVMGIGEVIKSLPRLLKIRKNFKTAVLERHPDVFVGIDGPDFNLSVELFLKKSGIRTVHYVSPSVWAWRSGRIHKIKAATDMVLSILPFEKDFYARYDAPCTYVGHRLAEEIPMEYPITAARLELNFSESVFKSNMVTAVLPGSRIAEITFLTPEFAEAAYLLQKSYPGMRFICAATSAAKARLISRLWREHAPSIPLTIWVGKSHAVMAAANAVILSSGTATLEAMLLKKRMVVCYIISRITAMIGKRVVKVDMYSLPNLLSGKRIVPELIQDDCNPVRICEEVKKIYTQENRDQMLEFARIHKELRMDSDARAAEAVLKVAES